MKFVKLILILIPVFFMNISAAGEPTKLFGKWKQVGTPNPVVWEFSNNAVVTRFFDGSGKEIPPNRSAKISYKELNDSWVMNFTTSDGKPGGGLLIVFKNENTIVIDDPGRLALVLKRANN